MGTDYEKVSVTESTEDNFQIIEVSKIGRKDKTPIHMGKDIHRQREMCDCILTSSVMGWKGVSVGKSSACSCGRRYFTSRHPHDSSQVVHNPFPGIECSLLTSVGTSTYMQAKHSHTYIKINK